MMTHYDINDIMALQEGVFRIPDQTVQALTKALDMLPQLHHFNRSTSYQHGDLIGAICTSISSICEARGLSGDAGSVESNLHKDYEKRKGMVLEEIREMKRAAHAGD
jgi:hypothetical protein